MIVDKAPELLCRVDFPVYQAVLVSPRHVLLGGGGGPSKTGVKNGFEIFEISHDGYKCIADSICRYDTNDFAIMNASAGSFDPQAQRTPLAVGKNGETQIYELHLTSSNIPHEPSDEKDNGTLRKRRSIANGEVTHKESEEFPALTFRVLPIQSFQTDFSLPEPYQKVVKFSPDLKVIATGGDDGTLRLWNTGNYSKIHEIKAHHKEIDDMDFSPDGLKVVSVSKDQKAFVWDVKKGKKHAEMTWGNPDKKVKYAYKRVRFGKVEGDVKKSKLFAIVNPIGTSKALSFLQRWETKSYLVESAVSKEGCLSALAVSDNGHFVATGTMMDGTVDIYTAFNLGILKRVLNSHTTFITGLEFLPTSDEAAPSRGFSDASLISISVDHRICIHHIPRQRHISMFWASIIIIVLLSGVFILCSYLGL